MTDYVSLPPYQVSFPSVPLSEGVDWGVSSYGIPALWKQSKGAGVLVAVIDTGIAPHFALKDAVVDWRNFSGDSDKYDTNGHSTHVAGIIGARRGAAVGIAPECEMLSLKALGHSGMGSMRAVSDAIHFAIEAKADIISMSLGSTRPDDHLHAAIRHANKAGIIVVCAAGNDGGAVNFPAAFQETIGVGAVDKNGKACDFSCRGKEIIVAAPGQDITSTWLNDGYATISGTSMAAPFVSGVLALYVSEQKREHQKVDQAAMLKALQATCQDVGDPGKDPVYGWGLVDPHKLMNYTASSVGGVTIFIPGARVL